MGTGQASGGAPAGRLCPSRTAMGPERPFSNPGQINCSAGGVPTQKLRTKGSVKKLGYP